ncbi:MAG: hypothetical protein ACK4YO_03595, partial [Candidatus Altarchaeaceae archaeon]
MYRIITETLFETWVMARSINIKGTRVEPRDYKEGEKVLAPLALWMHENTSGIVKEEKLKEEIIKIMKNRGYSEEESRKTTEEFFNYLADQTQLIIPKGKGYYGFRHLSFEEFLSARALIMNESYNEYLEKYGKYEGYHRWEEVLLLTVGWLGVVDGREKEVTRIVEKLIETKDIKKLLLAVKIVVEGLGVRKEVGEKVVENVGHLMMKKDPLNFWTMKGSNVLIVLSKALQIDEGSKTRTMFIEKLKNRKENEKVRKRAAYWLSRLVKDNEEIREILIGILKDRGEKIGVRGIVAYSLSRLVKDDKEIREIFIEILKEILKDREEDEELRKIVAFGLSILSELVKDDKEIRKIFIEILKDRKEDGGLREVVAFGLSILVKDDKEIRKIFIEILKDRKEE